MTISERDLPRSATPRREIPQFVSNYSESRIQVAEYMEVSEEERRYILELDRAGKVLKPDEEEALCSWKEGQPKMNKDAMELTLDFMGLFKDIKRVAIEALDLRPAGGHNWVTQQTSIIGDETVLWHVILKGQSPSDANAMAVYVEGANSFLNFISGQVSTRESTPSLEFHNVPSTRGDFEFYRKTLENRIY